MSEWQEDAARGDTMRTKAMGQLLGGLLAALVGIDVEGDIDPRTAGGTGPR